MLLAVAGVSAAAELKPFDASFTVVWRGMSAGTANLSLKKIDGERWRYESNNAARGIFKVALPGAITQSSDLRIEDGRIVPLHFITDDGTQKGKDDADVTFDWSRGRATGNAEGKPVDAPLQPGVQDTLSVQIALIHELLAGRTPTSFVLLDGNEVKDYEYAAEGKERVETVLGPQETLRYRSRRPGSDRSTVFWCAPALGYLPVKVERHRGSKVDWSMTITALKRD
ncbi:MAG: DUF3108 domain-containing protein [Steroidobacteraceae bacterium]